MINPKLKDRVFTSLATFGLAATSHGSIQIGHSLDELVRRPATGSSAQEDFFWDIDGDGTNDAQFRLRAFSAVQNFFPPIGPPIPNRFGAVNAQLLNAADDGFGFLVGGSNSLRSVASSGVLQNTTTGSFRGGFSAGTFNSGPTRAFSFTNGQTVGFQFQRDGATHYGVAVLSVFSGDSFGESVQLSLTNVRWNDEAGGDIQGDSIAVPEPASVGTGLGLLALGAAGLRSFRRKARAA